MEKVLRIISLIKDVLNAVLPWWENRKLAKALTVATDAIEVAQTIQDLKKDDHLRPEIKVKLVKKVVIDLAKEAGVTDYFEKQVKKYKDRATSRIILKADKFIGRWLK